METGESTLEIIADIHVFPAYLQGMETHAVGAGGGWSEGRSQPTYKGWKHSITATGMIRYIKFPAYLQGMETWPVATGGDRPGGSQPTYKGWKQAPRALYPPQGRPFPAYLQGMETGTERKSAKARKI